MRLVKRIFLSKRWKRALERGRQAVARGQVSPAREHLFEAHRCAQKIFGPRDPRLADTLQATAAAYHCLDDPQATAMESRVFKLRSRRSRRAEQAVAEALLSWLGNDAYSQQPAGEELLELAVSHAQRLGRGDHRYACIVGTLGALRLSQGRIHQGESLMRTALSGLELAYGRELDPFMPDVAGRLAGLYSRHHYYTEARALLRHSLRLQEKRWGGRSLAAANVLHRLGQMALCDFDLEPAQRYLRRALELSQAEDPSGPGAMEVAASLGGCLHACGKLTEAEGFYRLYLTYAEARQGPDGPRVAESLHHLMAVLYARGEAAQAETVLGRILKLEGRAPSEVRLGVAARLRAFGYSLDQEHLLRESLRIRERVLGKRHPLVAQSQADLALCLGDSAEGRSLRKRADRRLRRLRSSEAAELAAGDRALALQLGYWASLRRREGRTADACALVRRAESLLPEDGSGRLRERLARA